jgi:hypothetical protein
MAPAGIPASAHTSAATQPISVQPRNKLSAVIALALGWCRQANDGRQKIQGKKDSGSGNAAGKAAQVGATQTGEDQAHREKDDPCSEKSGAHSK